MVQMTILDGKSIQDELESIVDRIGLNSTVALLATICELKGDHIAENWQDMTTAKGWHESARTLDSITIRMMP
jgi:hypothetical protein